MGGVLVFVLYITSLLTNEIGRYLNCIQQRKSVVRGMLKPIIKIIQWPVEWILAILTI